MFSVVGMAVCNGRSWCIQPCQPHRLVQKEIRPHTARKSSTTVLTPAEDSKYLYVGTPPPSPSAITSVSRTMEAKSNPDAIYCILCIWWQRPGGHSMVTQTGQDFDYDLQKNCVQRIPLVALGQQINLSEGDWWMVVGTTTDLRHSEFESVNGNSEACLNASKSRYRSCWAITMPSSSFSVMPTLFMSNIHFQ